MIGSKEQDIMKKEFNHRPNKSIKDALEMMSKVGEKCLAVLDDEEKLLGTLSGGDLRRSILKWMQANIYHQRKLF